MDGRSERWNPRLTMGTFKGTGRCSFCGKGRGEGGVKHLVAGAGVYICDQCVSLCSEIITEEDEKGGA